MSLCPYVKFTRLFELGDLRDDARVRMFINPNTTTMWKPGPGWKKLEELNRKRAKAKRVRLKKEELYRHMVGSGRELKRKQKELRDMGLL